MFLYSQGNKDRIGLMSIQRMEVTISIVLSQEFWKEPLPHIYISLLSGH